MSFWEKLGLSKKVETGTESTGVQIEAIDQKIVNLQQEKRLADGNSQVQIDQEIERLTARRNILWEKIRREGEKKVEELSQ